MIAIPTVRKFVDQPRKRKVAVLLALVGTLTTPIPIVGIHKFYLRQYVWGMLYLFLGATPIPHVACAIEAVWYLAQDKDEWESRFNNRSGLTETKLNSQQVNAIAESLRQLDKLRQEGLITEYEFEQKRRKMLDHIV